MAHIIAKRGLAGNPRWEPIADPNLSSFAPLYERARIELDTNAHALQDSTLTLIYRPGIALGQWLGVLDSLTGETYVGKVKSISLEGEGATLLMKLVLSRPTVE